jgi:PAS domain S-box-containing protein
MDAYRERAQDTGQKIDNRPHRIGFDRWAWVPILFGSVAIIAIWLADFRMPYGPDSNLFAFNLVFNFIFSTLLALAVSTVFGRSFLSHGTPGLLLFGCCTVILGISGIATLVNTLTHSFDVNKYITIRNVCVWEASLCCLAGATLLLRWGSPLERRGRWLIFTYALAASVAGFTILAARSGWTPVFFVEGVGGTQVRHLVLGSTIVTFLLTAWLFQSAALPVRSLFLQWVTLSLSFLAASAFSLMFENVFGERPGMIGQASQYVGGFYMLMAALTAFRRGDNQLEVLAQPRNNTRHPYSIAIVIVFLAAVLRMVFLQAMGTQAVFITFFPAVMLASLYGGFRVGVLATFISVAIVDYFWITPFESFTVGDTSDKLSIATFLAVGILVSWVSDRLQRAESKIRITEATRREELERLVAERTAELSSEVDVRSQAEQALRQNEERARLLEDTLTQGVVYRDRGGKVVRMNPAAETILGRSIEELYDYSKNVEYEALREDGSPFPKHEHPIMEALRTGKIVSKVVMGIFNQRMKMYRWLIIDAVPLFHPGEDTPYEAYTIFSDITERKQAESAVRESRAKLSAALDSMSDAVFISDKEGNLIESNDAFATYHRYKSKNERSKCFADCTKVLDVWMADGTSAPPNMWAMPRALRGESATNVEYTLRRKDTGETWIGSYSFAPIRDASGAVVGSVVVARDITESKQAETAIRESRAKLSAALESMTDAVFISDKEGRFIEFNEGFATFHKFRNKDEAATTLSEYPEFLDVYMDDGTLAPLDKWAVPRALRGETCTNAEYTLRRKDTGETWVGLYSFAPIRDASGEIVGSVVVGRDITYRKRIEEDLRRTSDLLRAITKYSPDLIFAKDCQCRLVHASDSLLHLLGKKPEEVLGKTDAEFHADPKVGEIIMENDRIVRETGLPLVVEERAELPDGTLRTFRSTKVPWLSEDGSLLGTFGIAVDINELKTKEQELSKAREAAERADLSKSKFLAAASHDLRQPVQSLALLLTILEKHSSNNPKIAKTADMMKMAMGSLTGMLSSILDISRLDAGAVKPDMKGVDIGEIVGRLGKEYALVSKDKGLKLRSVPRGLRAWTDPDLFERALRNLIENALRYTKKGGILVGVRQRGERVRIDVVDTGIGIAADKQSEIFVEFYQVNNPGRDGTQGMGLGLSIVARLIRLIGAEVQVASQVGRGSRFSLLLPLHYGKDAIVMDRKSAALDDPGGRILLIEDNATLRQGLQVVLESWSYDVLTAVSGEEALDIAARLDWELDAILADYRLGPGFTGIATAQEIERRAGKSIPTLVLTGDTAKERISEILASGYAILHKPVNAEDLRQNLAKLLSEEDKVPLPQSTAR